MNISITILENNFDVEYELEITSPGSSGSPPSMSYDGDPGYPAEFKVMVLGIARSAKPKETLELPDWLKELIQEDLYERDAVQEAVQTADRQSR